MSPSPRASLLPKAGGDGSDRKGKNTASPVMLLLMVVQDRWGMGFAWTLITSEGCLIIREVLCFLSAVCIRRCRLAAGRGGAGARGTGPRRARARARGHPASSPGVVRSRLRGKKKKRRCRLVTAGPGNVTVRSVLISGFSCVPPGGAFLDSLLLKLLFCGSEWSNTSSGVASEHYKFQRALFCGHWVEWLLQCLSFLGYLRSLSGPRCL